MFDGLKVISHLLAMSCTAVMAHVLSPASSVSACVHARAQTYMHMCVNTYVCVCCVYFCNLIYLNMWYFF
jgi:hypothetical protein